jgi:hypothetical protein
VKQKFFIWLVVSILVAGLPLVGAAQKRKKATRPKTAKSKPVAKPAESTVAATPVMVGDPDNPPPVSLPPVKIEPASSETVAARMNLLASLPAGDAVAFVDLKRILTDALPAVLAHDPQRLAKVNAQLDRFQKDTGLDPRSFERVAMSFRLNTANGNLDAKPFALVSGTFNAGALIAVGRFAAEGKYKQEEYKGKQIYVFEAGPVLKDIPLLNMLPNQTLALTDLGPNMLALGDLATLREVLDAKGETPRANQDVIALATRNPNALIGLGGNIPAGTAKSLGLDEQEDEIGKTVSAIRQTAASVGLAEQGAEINIAARTEKDADAKNLTDTLNALKQFAGFALGNLKPDQQKLALNALETLNITQSGNETKMSLAIKRQDFPALLGLIK